MRADRLLTLLMLLQTRKKVTAQTLAKRLEVSERTIYRDLEALSSAGIPVYAERGPRGGWSLLGDYRVNPKQTDRICNSPGSSHGLPATFAHSFGFALLATA